MIVVWLWIVHQLTRSYSSNLMNDRHTEPLCPEAPDMLQFKSIEEWLASLKLSRYVDNFQQAGVTTLDAVTRLSHADLSGLGIVLLGHQRKIMNSIQAMRAQLSISMSEGFLVWVPVGAPADFASAITTVTPTNSR